MTGKKIFNGVPFVNFGLCIYVLRNPCLSQIHILLWFFSLSFIVLVFYIHDSFQVLFAYRRGKGWVCLFVFFNIWISRCSRLFVEKTIFSPLNCLSKVVKNQLTIVCMCLYIWILYSIPLIYMSSLGQHHVVYCSFKALKCRGSLEI